METPEECSTWWSDLPEDFKEETLAWLPRECLCRNSSACREWNALFSSTKFITNQWAMAPPNKKPWLVISHPGWTQLRCMAYCFFTKTWKTISLSFLREKYQFHSACLTASGAGLFLLTRTLSRTIVICNPLTRTSFKLPRTGVVNPTIGITRGDGHGGETYKVIMVANLRNTQRVAQEVRIYDSSLKSWRTAGVLPENFRATGTVVGKSIVVSEDFLFCEATELNSRRHGLLRFSIRTEAFIFVPMPQMEVPDRDREDHLLICGARILIATCILQAHLGILRDIIIWELDGAGLDPNGFREIARLPSVLMKDFNVTPYPPFRPFHFEGVGDLVCMTHNDWDRLVTYNLSRESWDRVPRRDEMGGLESFIAISSFEPRPEMKVN